MVTKTKLPGPFKQSWHAVSIAAGPVACPAAEALRHKRFLSDEAPPTATSRMFVALALQMHLPPSLRSSRDSSPSGDGSQ